MLLKKRGVTLLVGLMILLVAGSLVPAGSYGSGAYSAGDYNIGAVSPPTDSGGSSSEGGSSWQCSADEDCGAERYCLKHVCYDYSCYSDADCDIKTGETCWMHRCVKLFDVKIIDFQSPIELGTEFEFTYFLKGMADVSGDVEVHFWIEKDGEAVTSGHDTIYIGNFEEKTEKTKIYLPTTVESGVYTFFVQLNYGEYLANTHRTIEIMVDEGGVASIIGVSETAAKGFELYAIPVLVGFALFMIFIIFWLERKKIKAGIIKEEKWIKKHKVTATTSMLFVVLGVLVYCLNSAGFISLSAIGQFFISLSLWFKINISPYFYYILSSVLVLIVLAAAIILCKKNHVVQRIKSLLKDWKKLARRKRGVVRPKTKRKLEITKPVVERVSFVSEHKKLVGVLSSVIVLIGLVSYLFYSGIFTMAFLQVLWNGIAGWFGSVVGGSVSFAKIIYSYLSPQNRYFYPVIASVVGFVVLLALGIVVKRNNLLGRFREWREQKRIIDGRRSKDVQVKVVRAKTERFEDFKEAMKRHRVLLIVLGTFILGCSVVGALFYGGVVTVEQISEGVGNFLGSVSEGVGNFLGSVRSGWESVLSVIKASVVAVGNFVKDYSVYIISSVIGAVVLLVSYFKRESLAGLFGKSSGAISGMSNKQRVIISSILSVVSLGVLVYALFYYGVLSIEQFGVSFSNLGRGISELGKNMASPLSWVIQNYVYLVAVILAVVASVIFYRKRNEVRQVFYRIKDFVIGHRSFFLILLGLAVISGIIFYLFSLRVVAFEKLGNFIQDYYVYVLSFAVGAILIWAVYLKRKGLVGFVEMLPYRFMGLSKTRKIVALVILAVFLLADLIYVLFYCGVLSAEQFSVFFSNMVGGISFTVSLGSIIKNFFYSIGGVLVIALIVIFYLNRRSHGQMFYSVKRFLIEHKLFFLIFLGLVVILPGIMFYLFYSKIITLEKLRGIFDYIEGFLS